jgi:hypothetical protein
LHLDVSGLVIRWWSTLCGPEANPDTFGEVAALDALGERTWNHPVVAGRHLLVRNDREAVCHLLPISTPASSQDVEEADSVVPPTE